MSARRRWSMVLLRMDIEGCFGLGADRAGVHVRQVRVTGRRETTVTEGPKRDRPWEAGSIPDLPDAPDECGEHSGDASSRPPPIDPSPVRLVAGADERAALGTTVEPQYQFREQRPAISRIERQCHGLIRFRMLDNGAIGTTVWPVVPPWRALLHVNCLVGCGNSAPRRGVRGDPAGAWPRASARPNRRSRLRRHGARCHSPCRSRANGPAAASARPAHLRWLSRLV
jgi:hypothetical protein